jgi:hypothetical protein
VGDKITDKALMSQVNAVEYTNGEDGALDTVNFGDAFDDLHFDSAVFCTMPWIQHRERRAR